MTPTAERWNLGAFGMAANKPSYSLLVREGHTAHGELGGYGHTWTWSTSSVHEQTQLFKMAILLTAVMLNLTMHNRYVSDVTFWIIVFLVVAYGVLDAAVRRVSELVGAVEQMYPQAKKSNILFTLGYLFKVGVVVLGLMYIYYETYQSPLVNSYWVKKSTSSAKFEMEDNRGPDKWDSENWVLGFTMALWSVIAALDLFRDWRFFMGEQSPNQKKLVLSTASNEESKTYQLLVQAFLFFYFFAGLYTIYFGGLLSTWTQNPELTAKLTYYEWHRNNWLYGVSQQTPLMFHG